MFAETRTKQKMPDIIDMARDVTKTISNNDI